MPDLPDRFQPEAVLSLTAPQAGELPRRLLYATSSGIGGTGLDSTALEGVRASHRGDFLAEAICYGIGNTDIPCSKLRSLQWHPVRALSFLDSDQYYGAKKRYADWIAARELRLGDYDAFHGWSGDCFRTLIEARLKRLPSVIDIPTWHRNKGSAKRGETGSERAARLSDRSWRQRLPIERARAIAEYDLADVILVPSRKCADTFLAAGVDIEKLHYVARGVDPQRYSPGTPPQDKLRFIFAGALIKRKGVHHLLAAWKKLNLRNAELVLVGSLHDEIKAPLADAGSSVRHLGFSSRLQDELKASSAFVFPSECEGFAKVTLEAAACALPIITTAESGDSVVHEHNGLLIEPNDVDSLCAAIEHFATHRDQLAAMGHRGRERVLSCLTWDHYRQRLLHGYLLARQRQQARAK